MPGLQQSPMFERFRDDVAVVEQVWRRLFLLMRSICMTHSWCEQNDAIIEACSLRSLTVSDAVGLRVSGNDAHCLCENIEAKK